MHVSPGPLVALSKPSSTPSLRLKSCAPDLALHAESTVEQRLRVSRGAIKPVVANQLPATDQTSRISGTSCEIV